MLFMSDYGISNTSTIKLKHQKSRSLIYDVAIMPKPDTKDDSQYSESNHSKSHNQAEPMAIHRTSTFINQNTNNKFTGEIIDT